MFSLFSNHTAFLSVDIPPSPTTRMHPLTHPHRRTNFHITYASRPPTTLPRLARLLTHFTPRFVEELQYVDIVSVACMFNRFSNDGSSKNCTKNRNILPREVFVSATVPRKPIVSYFDLSLPPNSILFVSFSYHPTFPTYTSSTRLHATFRFHSDTSKPYLDQFPPSFSELYTFVFNSIRSSHTRSHYRCRFCNFHFFFVLFNVLPPTLHSDPYIVCGPHDIFIKLRLFYRLTIWSSLLGYV